MYHNIMTPNLDNGCDVLVMKGLTTALDNVLQLVKRNLIVLDKFGNDLDRQVIKPKPRPLFKFFLGHQWHGIGDKEASVWPPRVELYVTDADVMVGTTNDVLSLCEEEERGQIQ
jgi:hypothetical protein